MMKRSFDIESLVRKAREERRAARQRAQLQRAGEPEQEQLEQDTWLPDADACSALFGGMY